MEKSKKQSQPDRRRGRPAGKNRVPLSQEEKRARNALYERERRQENAEATMQLAEVIGCDPNISNGDLLAKVITMIQQNAAKNAEESIDDLLRINLNLESQIATLQERLGINDDAFDQLDEQEFQPISQPSSSSSQSQERPLKKQAKKRKASSQNSQPEKRIKTRSETSIDSGVGSYSHSISPELIAEEIVSNEQQPHTVPRLEEQDQVVTQSYVDLQTELYDELFTPATATTVPEWVDTNVSVPFMDCLTQSLIVPPAIVAPPSPDLPLQQQAQPEPSSVLNTESTSSSGFLPQSQVEITLDYLSDNERILISDWLDKELFNTSGVEDSTKSGY